MTVQVASTDRRSWAELGHVMRAARERRGLSIRAMAGEASMSTGAIQSLEHGREVKRRTYVAVANYFGVRHDLVIDAAAGAPGALAELRAELDSPLPDPSTLDDATLWKYRSMIDDELRARFERTANALRAYVNAPARPDRRATVRAG